jgi:methyl-accepting chemotaxis protein
VKKRIFASFADAQDFARSHPNARVIPENNQYAVVYICDVKDDSSAQKSLDISELLRKAHRRNSDLEKRNRALREEINELLMEIAKLRSEKGSLQAAHKQISTKTHNGRKGKKKRKKAVRKTAPTCSEIAIGLELHQDDRRKLNSFLRDLSIEVERMPTFWVVGDGESWLKEVGRRFDMSRKRSALNGMREMLSQLLEDVQDSTESDFIRRQSGAIRMRIVSDDNLLVGFAVCTHKRGSVERAVSEVSRELDSTD